MSASEKSLVAYDKASSAERWAAYRVALTAARWSLARQAVASVPKRGHAERKKALLAALEGDADDLDKRVQAFVKARDACDEAYREIGASSFRQAAYRFLTRGAAS